MGGINGEHFGRRLVHWESRPGWYDLVAVSSFLSTKKNPYQVLIIQAPPHTEGSWALCLTSQSFVSLMCKTVLLMRNMVMAVTGAGGCDIRKKSECNKEIYKLLNALQIIFYFSQSHSTSSTSCP